MAYQQKNNTGALFKNRPNPEKEAQDAYSGNMTVDGKEYWIRGNIRYPGNDTTKPGFISMTYQAKAPRSPAEASGGSTGRPQAPKPATANRRLRAPHRNSAPEPPPEPQPDPKTGDYEWEGNSPSAPNQNQEPNP